ncbi:MAG: nuclear transport factor 2 family protein [Actinomycetota bacterium]|nr:nuclear transport factor 2 family protein [Actinomycetota bacterium]
MPDEASRKAVVSQYCQAMNAGDLDGCLKLFSPDVRFEDPVGSAPMIGLAAVRKHLAQAIDNQVRETPGEIVASMDAEHVVLPVRITMRTPQVPAGSLARINLISVIQVGPDGLMRDVQVFWGQSDLALVPEH